MEGRAKSLQDRTRCERIHARCSPGSYRCPKNKPFIIYLKKCISRPLNLNLIKFMTPLFESFGRASFFVCLFQPGIKQCISYYGPKRPLPFDRPLALVSEPPEAFRALECPLKTSPEDRKVSVSVLDTAKEHRKLSKM